MATELVPITEREELFIDTLIENDGNVAKTARDLNFSSKYGYYLRNKLGQHIAAAAQEYLSMHTIKAAKFVVGTLDDELPNPIKLNAANSILDRGGVLPKKEIKEQEEKPIIKANIFILPEKRYVTIDGS